MGGRPLVIVLDGNVLPEARRDPKNPPACTLEESACELRHYSQRGSRISRKKN
jgi:hypothetical protein